VAVPHELFDASVHSSPLTVVVNWQAGLKKK